MNINEHEMRGLITGKAMPADIFVGESLAAYLVRKFTNLHTERDALAAENAALKLAIESHKHGFMRCECCGEENMCHNDDVCRALDENPATDAYLNSVRAEGVESFVNGGCTYEIPHRIKNLALSFAAQLRAGEPS